MRKKKKVNYEVNNPEIQDILKKLGYQIGGVLPPGWGFMLMIFDFKSDGSMFYISNGSRQDVIKAMIEFINKQQEGVSKN